MHVLRAFFFFRNLNRNKPKREIYWKYIELAHRIKEVLQELRLLWGVMGWNQELRYCLLGSGK